MGTARSGATSGAAGDSRDFYFGGFRAAAAKYFIAMVRRAVATEKLASLHQHVAEALEEWHRPAGKDQFLTRPRHEQWQHTFAQLVRELTDILAENPYGDGLPQQARSLIALWSGAEFTRQERNRAWVAHQRVQHSALFTTGLGHSLTDEQVQAVLRDEHRSLIVAGAGTGKTSTIVSKIQWIRAQMDPNASRVRSLAFNRKAAGEINERLHLGADEEPIATTFHSIGLSLAAQARGRKPRLTELADDDRLLQAFLRSCIDTGLATSSVASKVITFLAYFRYPEPNPVPVTLSHDANRWADGHDIRSITGVKLRSNSEALIANWLTLHGVRWEYEKEYPLDTATVQYGQYRPDFYLPDYEIWIEHWACSRSGALPETWDKREQEQYREGMRWKRALHERRQTDPLQGTNLLETYSGDDVVSALASGLQSMGVSFTPLSEEEVRQLVNTDEVIAPVVLLIKNFLALFRESGETGDALRVKLERTQDGRGRAFLDMFEWVHGQYVAHLASEGAIDFSDMIREATQGLVSGAARLVLDYLLVDEFQDISRGRARLLKAILSQNPECRLFAVGDDWQSIYRFAGSDVQVMVGFAGEFGPTERNDLRQTHRFGSKLLTATSRFIQANPQQLKKDLVSARADQLPSIEIVSAGFASRSVIARTAPTAASPASTLPQEVPLAVTADEEELLDWEGAASRALSEILRRIADELDGASVLVLGRYKSLAKRLSEPTVLPKGLQITFSTVHKAKGLEADYVVVLDVVTGRYGFPSEIEDDPLMNLVLSSEAGIPNAEERRLFYVALTRARRRAFVITSDHHRSPFVDELEGEPFVGLVIKSSAKTRVVSCPVCVGGTLRHVVGRYGAFYACSSSRCRGRAVRCPHCGDGGFVRSGDRYTCLFCKESAESCPNCDQGYIKHISAGVSREKGRAFDAFDACSTNRKDPYYNCFTRACSCARQA